MTDQNEFKVNIGEGTVTHRSGAVVEYAYWYPDDATWLKSRGSRASNEDAYPGTLAELLERAHEAALRAGMRRVRDDDDAS